MGFQRDHDAVHRIGDGDDDRKRFLQLCRKVRSEFDYEWIELCEILEDAWIQFRNGWCDVRHVVQAFGSSHGKLLGFRGFRDELQ